MAFRCGRCMNGAVVAVNTTDSSASSTSTSTDSSNSSNKRPTEGPYVDISMTLPQMPSEFVCRNCGWKREADGMSRSNAIFVDSSTEFSLLPLEQVPLHPGLDAGGRNDDTIQRLMRMPKGVLCTVCGGASCRVEEEVVKSCLQSYASLPKPPSDVASRASWWGFKNSRNFESGHNVILEWYFLATRAIEGNRSSQSVDDNVDLCIGCGRVCIAKFSAPRSQAKANLTGALPPEWAAAQKEREREYRRKHPKRIPAERGDNGLPVDGTGGYDYGSDEELTDDEELEDDDDDDDEENDNDNDDADDNNKKANDDDEGLVIRQLIPGKKNKPHTFIQPHDQLIGAQKIEQDDSEKTAIVADVDEIKEATTARLVSLQQVRILEEARKAVVSLLEVLLGPGSKWPRSQEAIDEKQDLKELWRLASMIWVLASSSPTKTGATLEWTLARDFLTKVLFKTERARNALDSLLARDPRDPDILIWSERWCGVHIRAASLIFARRLHDCVPLVVDEELRFALRDAVAVAQRTRALRLMSQDHHHHNNNDNSNSQQTQKASAIAAAASSSQDSSPHHAVTQPSSSSATTSTSNKVFQDIRTVRFPIHWITPHAWKNMQQKAFRFCLFLLKHADRDGRRDQGCVYLVAVRLMLRFMTDATALTEGSVFSLVCGLPYNDDEEREYVAIDFRDPLVKPQVSLGLDRLLRISRGANWEEPNPAWQQKLMFTCSNPASEKSNKTRELVSKMKSPESITKLVVVDGHETIEEFNNLKQ